MFQVQVVRSHQKKRKARGHGQGFSDDGRWR